MLATYFKEYPAHLAEAARKQAESKKLVCVPEMTDFSHHPTTDTGQPAPSESGRTYTVSDTSEDNQGNGNRRENTKMGTFERFSPTKLRSNSGPRSLGALNFNPPSEDEMDQQPLSLGYFSGNITSDKRSGPTSLGSLPVFKSYVEDRVDSLDFSKHKTKYVLDNKERSLSFEIKNSRSEVSRLRSSSLDYRRLRNRSSSEIANNYLPDSLKNFIKLANVDIKSSSTSNVSISSSSDGEGLSTTTFNMTNLPAPSDTIIHEPDCRMSAPQIPSGNQRKSLTPSTHSSLSKSTSHSHIQNGGSCPVHGSKPHSHDLSNSAHSTPTHPRSRPVLSSLSSSAIVPRASHADTQVLNCGICTKRYKNPKVLPCLHTFCEKCLVDYTPPESLTLTCPICRQQSILPQDGVSGLRANPNPKLSGLIQSKRTPGGVSKPCSLCEKDSSKVCKQCDVYLCTQCAQTHEQDSGSDCHSVVSLDDSSPLSSTEPLVDETTLYCPSHAGQTLRFYCRNCETAVCSSCTDIEHRNHTTMRLNDAVDNQKMDLQRLIDEVTVQLPVTKETLCDLTDSTVQLEVNKKTAEKELRQCFRQLHDILDERQTELLNILNNHVTTKKNTIESQRDELDRWVSGVEDCCEYVEKSLSELPPTEVVLVKKQLGEKLLNYVEVEFPPIPRENAHIEFATGNIDALKSDLTLVGRIQTNNAVPQQTTAIGDALKRLAVGRQNMITVVTRDHKGARMKAGGADVKASVSKITVSKNGEQNHIATNGDAKVSPVSKKSNGQLDPVRVTDLKNGSYEVHFTVHSIGTYSLSVHLFGHHISASPFTTEAHMPSSSDALSEGSSGVKGQSRVYKRQTSKSTQATKKTSSSSNPPPQQPPSQKSSCSRRTLKEPLEDDLILKVGRRGRGRGEFVNPQGICYSSVKDGRIVVADSNNQCVQVFNLAGECKIKFGVRGRSVGQLQRPTGVAALQNGHYAIADYENRWVSVFEPSGKYVNRIGHGKLLGPKGMCVNRHGHLIVVDNKACSIFIFHPSGKLITKFGNRILEGYNFAGPHFCSVNSKGDIIVTDFHNHCVRLFSSEGVAKFTFGTNGEGNGQFNAPTGIAVDANDNIIVADWGNSRIQVFDSQGSFLSFVNTLADPLYGPQGLTLTAEGNIVVADSGNHCFKVYKYLQ